MEYFSTESFFYWLDQYGSVALFFLLALGIVALPIPDETLLIISGTLIRNGHLNLFPTLLFAAAGAICGITISYILGYKCGHPIILKYGSIFGLNQEKLDKGLHWFEKYGKWTLFFGYFIPGVRHFNGLTAGMVKLDYPIFALFSYTGALIWSCFFLTVGYFFGNYFSTIFQDVDIKADKLFLVLIIIVAIYFFQKTYRQKSK